MSHRDRGTDKRCKETCAFLVGSHRNLSRGMFLAVTPPLPRRLLVTVISRLREIEVPEKNSAAEKVGYNQSHEVRGAHASAAAWSL